MRLLKNPAERRAGLALALGLAAAVVVAACSGQSPASPSSLGDVSSTEVLYNTGNCNISGTTKDESAPFTLSGVDTIWIKAGRNCYGPYSAPSGSDDACWSITWNGDSVTVAATGASGCQGKGLSHIEGVVTNEPPPCEIDDKTGECKEPPPCEIDDKTGECKGEDPTK